MQSEKVSELLPALAAAMGDMRNPKKNAANPHFRNRFADLGEVLDCIREPLLEHGLVMTQHTDGENLRTRVWHASSGQWIESSTALVMDKRTAQAQGSAITYARRYALKAMFGMNDVDDDGQKASTPRQQVSVKVEPPQDKLKQFKDKEQALITLERCSFEHLDRWGKTVAVSGFDKQTLADLREAMAERAAILKEQLA